MYVSSPQVDWKVFLPAVIYAYNTSISEATGDTSFFLTYGRELALMPDTTMLPPVNLSPSLNFHRQRRMFQVQLARDMAEEHIQWAQAKMKQYYYHHSEEHSFQVGHRIWIYSPAVKTGQHLAWAI